MQGDSKWIRTSSREDSSIILRRFDRDLKSIRKKFDGDSKRFRKVFVKEQKRCRKEFGKHLSFFVLVHLVNSMKEWEPSKLAAIKIVQQSLNQSKSLGYQVGMGYVMMVRRGSRAYVKLKNNKCCQREKGT